MNKERRQAPSLAETLGFRFRDFMAVPMVRHYEGWGRVDTARIYLGHDPTAERAGFDTS